MKDLISLAIAAYTIIASTQIGKPYKKPIKVALVCSISLSTLATSILTEYKLTCITNACAFGCCLLYLILLIRK